MDFGEFSRVIGLLRNAYPSANLEDSVYMSHFEKHSKSGRLSSERLLSLLNEALSPKMDVPSDEIDLVFQNMKEGKSHELKCSRGARRGLVVYLQGSTL